MAIKKGRFKPPVYTNGVVSYPDTVHFETGASSVLITDTSNYFPETDAEGVLKNLGARTHFPATNLVTNGDFSKDSEGWTMSATTSIENGSLKNIGTTAYTVSAYETINFVLNHIYYFAVTAKNTSDKTIKNSLSGMDTTSNLDFDGNSAVFVRKSRLITIASGGNKQVNLGWCLSARNGSPIYIDDVSILDITQIFCDGVVGTGLEPSKEEMDKIMALYPNSWFDGTVNPLLTPKQMLDLIRAKANVVQENWITPTLLNGWVAFDTDKTLRYHKDSMGYVHIKGMIKSGTVGSSFPACTLPVGYRPIHILGFPCISNATIGFINVNSSGNITVTAGNNSYVYLDGITFKAEA